MKPAIKKECLKRMNYLNGHLDGIKKMLEKDAYCIDVIKQNKAVINALHKVNELILSSHLDTCVMNVSLGRNKNKQRAMAEELLGIYKTSNKV